MILDYIEIDIQKKFNISSPEFYLQGEKVNRKQVIQWIDIIFDEDEHYGIYRWPYYRHIKKHNFSLKSFFAGPPSNICLDMLNSSLDSIQKNSSSDNNTIFKAGFFYYTENELRKLLFNSMKMGYSDILAHELPSTTQPTIEISISDGGCLHHKITDGYMPLTYKEDNEHNI